MGMPCILFWSLQCIDVDVLSVHIVQNWVIWVFLALYIVSFGPFAYNMYCIINCEYYFFLVTPIKKPNVGIGSGEEYKMLMQCNVLPEFIENTKRNKTIWDNVEDKN